MKRTTRRRLISAGTAGVVGLAGCLGGGSDGGDGGDDATTTATETGDGTTTDATTDATTGTGEATTDPTDATTGEPTGTTRTATPTTTTPGTTTAELDGPDWKTRALTDVRTRNTFRIGAFEKPVLLETFAVWCPACTRQQNQIGKLRERRDDFVAVSLNVDPNENATKVFEHAKDHGFDWYFAVSPSPVTDSLVDRFGATVTVAPQAPVVRDCSGSATLLETGVKSADALAAALEEC